MLLTFQFAVFIISLPGTTSISTIALNVIEYPLPLKLGSVNVRVLSFQEPVLPLYVGSLYPNSEASLPIGIKDKSGVKPLGKVSVITTSDISAPESP